MSHLAQIRRVVRAAQRRTEYLILRGRYSYAVYRITAGISVVLEITIASLATFKIHNIVLFAAAAQNFRHLVYYQIVTIPVLYAQQVLDHDHNGLLSVQEASKNLVFSFLVRNFTLFLTQNIPSANGTTAKQQLSPQYNLNNDTS